MLPILHLGPFAFYTFGLAVACACLLGLFTFDCYFQRNGLPLRAHSIGAICIAGGFLGAKIDNALVVHHMERGISWQQALGSGYTYLGCVVVGSAAAMVYLLIRRIPLLRAFDSLFCIAPAYALGRLGCFLAGDGDYGRPSTLPWAVSFPHGLVPTTARVHPTMLYIAAWELLVFAVLWRISGRRRTPHLAPPGAILGLYLISTGTFRFVVEFLSRNGVVAFGLKESQLLSVVFIAGGAILLFARRQSVAPRETVREAPSPAPRVLPPAGNRPNEQTRHSHSVSA